MKILILTMFCFILSSPVFAADDPQANVAPAAVEAASGGAPLASQDHDAGDVEVGILEVKRTSGDTLTVKWQYKNTASENKTVVEGDAGAGGYGLAKNIYLIDPINKKKYLVVEDSQRIPVASKLGSYGKVEVEGGKTLNAWAKFPAPPPGTQKVSIYIPGAPPFEDVSITG